MNHWLLKSEPDSYSIDDFARDKLTVWDCIRNYRARNIMRDEIRAGDYFLFYHSMSRNAGVVGVGEVVGVGLPDMQALNPKSEYYDPRAAKENNPWVAIKVRFKKKFGQPVTLEKIKQDKRLKNMILLKISRLSVQPVTPSEFKIINQMGEGNAGK